MKFQTILVAAILFGTGASAQADTLYDSGTPTSPFTLLSSNAFAGARVVFGSEVTLTGIDAYIETQEGMNGEFRVSIFSDVGIGIPGAQLFAADFSKQDNVMAPDWTGASGLHWNLEAGAYWVMLRGLGGPNEYSGLLWGYAPNPLSRYVVRLNGGAYQRNGPVSNAGLRLFGEGGDPVSGGDPWPAKVPEPAAWALMILGFGAAGAGIRSARRRHPAIV